MTADFRCAEDGCGHPMSSHSRHGCQADGCSCEVVRIREPIVETEPVNAALTEAARTVRAAFLAYVDAGFTEAQALDLVRSR